MLLGAAGGRPAISKRAPVPIIVECALLRSTGEQSSFSVEVFAQAYEPRAALRASVSDTNGTYVFAKHLRI
jgi:hypothetical protein